MVTDPMRANAPKLADIGSKAIVGVAPDTPMSRAIMLMDEQRVSCLVVAEDGRPVGIVTERDLVRNISKELAFGQGSVDQFMSSPPIVAPTDMPYLEGYHRCAEHGIRHLILIDATGLLAGIVTETDFMQHLGLDAYVELKPVASVMTRLPLTATAEQTFGEALELMSTHNISCVVVARDHRPVGILSERDVVHLSQSPRNPSSRLLNDIMSTPVVTVRADATLHKASLRMQKRRIRRLVVVDEAGMLAGIVTEHDLVKGLESRYTSLLRQIIARQTKELSKTKRRLNESLVLEHILRASLDMAILATDTDRIVRYFNPVAEQVFGVDGRGAIGQPLEALCNRAQFTAGYLDTAVRAATAEGSHALEVQLPGPEGNRLFQCRIATIRDAREHILGYVHTLADITARKAAEEARERLQAELLQARKMEAIGQLTGGIAHDFNNILASVLGYTRLALDCDEIRDDGEVLDCLSEIDKAGKRAQALVRQLLTFSRSSPQHPRDVQLRSMIKEITTMLRSTVPAALRLDLDLERDVPAVHVDPVQIQQLVMNLVLNARDASGGRGTITVGLRLVREVDTVSTVTHRLIRGDWVELSVTDTGHGMTPEVLEQAFEPFFTTKEIGQGSGMGLAVVHGIVTQTGGEILVDSSPENGTGFRILFPPSEQINGAS